MSDVLTAPDDDLFWPPTQRTEAESPEVAKKADAWIYAFLGSRVTSFSPAPDRVIVWCALPPAIDMFTLPATMRGLVGLHAGCTFMPRNWEPSPVTMVSFAELNSPFGDASWYPTNPVVELEVSDVAEGEASSSRSDVEQALIAVKQLLGLTDEQVEGATGVSRSTLWRLRTGRTSGTRAVTEAPIWRLHSLARALVDRIGVDGARSWLHGGEPSPAALLAGGDLGLAEQAADPILFPDRAARRGYAAVAEDDYEAVVPLSSDATGPTKRPRRARRPGERSG